ncbi:MAG: sigma-54-dependent Fis family transcriptional regulator, partial [Planctomycetes bacterium]|nr:sigma-54-dependent Fis family transcriptional regulator [Planctomycetota bacterium]
MRSRSRILVVDDEELMRESMAETLRRAGYEVVTASDGRDARARLAEGGFRAVVSDLSMGEDGGLALLQHVRATEPETPVVLVTAYGTVENAVSAMKAGAFDFVTMPFGADHLEVVVRKAIDHNRLLRENQYLREVADESSRRGYVVGKSPAMKRLFDLVRAAATSEATALVFGESGVGKEVVARSLHDLGPRKDGPYLAVNCAALSAGLLESELFGHEKGAFTGADQARKGRFELADGGTLLLDEVSEVGIGLQAKLLRVLQEKEFERVGSNQTRRVDVRVVATTNRDLRKEVAAGRFREDLFFRLHVLPIEVPPLRERRETLGDLVEFFLDRFRRRGRGDWRIEPEALEALRGYGWPGNVRELENLLERVTVLHPGPVIRAEWVRAGLV